MRKNKDYDIEALPDVTKRIKQLIDEKSNGNTRQFCLSMGLTNSSKINRLFKLDKRSEKYPIPSTDVLMLISKSFNVNVEWLLNGNSTTQHVNNINIVSGDKNITDSTNVKQTSESEYIDIIKKQQSQIEKLMEIISQQQWMAK